jgi:gliding motility-associated-like protein
VKAYLLDAQQFDIVVLKPVTLDNEFNRICKTDAKISLRKTPVSKNLSFVWSNGDKTPIATFKNPGGDLSLVLSDTSTKCSVKVSTKVNFLENNIVVPKKDFSICMDEPVHFPIQLNLGTKDLNFQWNGPTLTTSDTISRILVKTNGTYTVKVSEQLYPACQFNFTFQVADKCEAVILAPNIFTPNGDGKNDIFIPVAKVAKRAQIVGLQILNRWGEILYSKSNASNLQWDGKFNGKRVPIDTYAWVVQYMSVDFPEKGIQTIRGAVFVVY